jgi:hypothetical protein
MSRPARLPVALLALRPGTGRLSKNVHEIALGAAGNVSLRAGVSNPAGVFNLRHLDLANRHRARG